jgi:enamine deaminase RidA (YjgF/YER057c/UK114 family)
MSKSASVTHINPESMHRNPAFSQAVAVVGPVKTIYVGAQTAQDASGAIVGKGDIAAQTEQVLANVETCLAAAGAGPEHIVTWTIYVKQGEPLQAAFGAFQRWWGARPDPPANSVVASPDLSNPDFLIAIDAVAVVPAERS